MVALQVGSVSGFTLSINLVANRECFLPLTRRNYNQLAKLATEKGIWQLR